MLMLFRTPAMVSFTRASGSLMVQLGVSSHDLVPLVHEVMKNGPSMAMNHFVGRNLARIPGQCVSAVHPGVGTQQPMLGEQLQYLGKQLGRNPVGVGHILGAQRSGLRMLGEILERHQPVVRFFGQLEHSISDFFGPYSVYDRFCRITSGSGRADVSKLAFHLISNDLSSPPTETQWTNLNISAYSVWTLACNYAFLAYSYL